jgi:hypothetical protein
LSQVIGKVLCTQEEFDKQQRDIFRDIVAQLLNTFPAKEIVSINIDHKLCDDGVEIVGKITYKERRNG